MRSTLHRPVDHDEWLALRAPFIGASEAAALVDEHPFLTKAELAVEKLGHKVRKETPQMLRGIHLEAAVADWVADEQGLTLVEPEDLYVWNDTLIATLDRRVEGTDIGVEIKTSNRYVAEVPRYWYWQCQVQILCADLDHVRLVVLDPRMDLQHFLVKPQPEDQSRIADEATKFLRFIRDGELPPDVDLTYRAATALHSEVTEEAVDLNDQTMRWCRMLGSLQGRIKSLQGDEDQLKAMIAHRLGNAAEGRYEGKTWVTWRQITRTDIDRKKLRAEHPELVKEYGTSQVYRSLRLKDVG